MIRLTMLRRAVLLPLVALVSGVTAGFVGSSPASADPACTGRLSHSASSPADSSIGYFRADGSTNFLRPGYYQQGTESNPVVKWEIFPGSFAKVEYYDLRTGEFLGEDVVDDGVYDKNPCHYAVVTTWW